MDASQGTATELASLAGADAEDLGLYDVSPTADASDDDLELGTGTVP